MKSILFVSHDANRAGAQVQLLRLVRLLQKNTTLQIEVLLKHDGVLREEFEQLVTTHIWQPFTPTHFWSSWRGNSQINSLKRKKFDVIVSNTLTNGDILPELAKLHCPIITYVHELAAHLDMYTNATDFKKTLQLSDFYLVCAQIAAQFLEINHQVSAQKTAWLPSCLPPIDVISLPPVQTVRATIGLTEADFVVGGIGTADLRKGIDYFLNLAIMLPQVAFVWVGADVSQFREVLNNPSFPPNLKFVPNTPDPYQYLNCFDVLALTSRMEVYPLVVMEALYLSKPVLCFDKAGGAPELVETDAGVVIPDFSVKLMAQKVLWLQQNPIVRSEMGKKGRQKVVERHNEVVICERFMEVVNRVSTQS
ncbi:MAG: glycosyltransferase family 4 protein [Spirosomataceae bacterium]